MFIIFIVSGFWHGANWTFIVWGALNACYYLPLFLLGQNRNHMEIVAKESWLPSLDDALKMFATFSMTVLAWVFFRAEHIGHAFSILGEIFSSSLFESPGFGIKTISVLIIGFMIIEWLGRRGEYAIEKLGLNWPRFIRWVFYIAIVLSIFLLGGQEQEFIYFQF